jgi:hypothetical protein
MSTRPAMSPDSGATPTRDVPQATDAYRKAHKAYVLVSGMLASWELIGITLDTKGKWGIELKSPNAVPLILFTLLFYSGYKMTVEWLQCDSARRKDRIARLDFWVAHFIALAAIVIPIFQFLARIRIADWLTGHIPPQPEPPRIPIPVNMFLFMGVFWGVATGMLALFAWKTYGLVKRSIVLLSLPVTLYCAWRLVIVEGSLKTYLLVLAAIALGIFWPVMLEHPAWLTKIETRLAKMVPRSSDAGVESKSTEASLVRPKD